GRGGRRAGGRAGQMAHLVAAVGMGADQVGAEVLIEALTAAMPGVGEQLAAAVRQAEADGTLDTWLAPMSTDPLGRLAAASQEQMAQARGVAGQLGGVGGLYLAYGLGMPDTPALSALRARIDELGLGQLLVAVATSMVNPFRLATVLSSCLVPEVAVVAGMLQALVARHAADGLLHRPDVPGGPEDFMREWLTALGAAATRGDCGTRQG
ncbi:hypothetical protein P2L57_39505, partial [Streptomyces ferralitis]|nr:hypothetical protein [Streptantibioticus ferralitis]